MRSRRILHPVSSQGTFHTCLSSLLYGLRDFFHATSRLDSTPSTFTKLPSPSLLKAQRRFAGALITSSPYTNERLLQRAMSLCMRYSYVYWCAAHSSLLNVVSTSHRHAKALENSKMLLPQQWSISPHFAANEIIKPNYSPSRWVVRTEHASPQIGYRAEKYAGEYHMPVECRRAQECIEPDDARHCPNHDLKLRVVCGYSSALRFCHYDFGCEVCFDPTAG